MQRSIRIEWLVFALATLAATLAAGALLGAPIAQVQVAPQPLPVQPVESSNAVWMAAISVLCARGSSGISAFTMRKSRRDQMEFDAKFREIEFQNVSYRKEIERCEERSQSMEAEIRTLRAEVSSLRAELAKFKGS